MIANAMRSVSTGVTVVEVGPLEVAVDADERRRADLDVHVGRLALDGVRAAAGRDRARRPPSRIRLRASARRGAEVEPGRPLAAGIGPGVGRFRRLRARARGPRRRPVRPGPPDVAGSGRAAARRRGSPTVAATESRSACEVVAALEEHDEPARAGANAATRAVRSAKSPAESPRPVSGSARWASKPAETSTQVGREVLDERARRPCRAPRGRRRRSRRPGSGKFTVVPAPAPVPGLVEPAGARIERPLVQRHVEDVGSALEDVLGAVAVVRVPVDDRAPARPGRRARPRRPRRCSAGRSPSRARAPRGGRAGGPRRNAASAVAARRARRSPRARRRPRRARPRTSARRPPVSASSWPPPARAQPLERVEVRGRVHPLELGPGRAAPASSVRPLAVDADRARARRAPRRAGPAARGGRGRDRARRTADRSRRAPRFEGTGTLARPVTTSTSTVRSPPVTTSRCRARPRGGRSATPPLAASLAVTRARSRRRRRARRRRVDRDRPRPRHRRRRSRSTASRRGSRPAPTSTFTSRLTGADRRTCCSG